MDNSTGKEKYENEFTEIIEKWKSENENSGYDPIPILNRLSELIEEQTVEFQKADPDPFDDRHPKAIIPGCGLGIILHILTKEDDLAGKVINDYLRHGTSVNNPSQVTIAAARLLLVTMPGIDVNVINNATHNILDLLYKWSAEAPNPLKTYAVGILAVVIQNQDIIVKYTKRNLELIPILIKELNELIANKQENNEKTFNERKRKPSVHSEKFSKYRKLSNSSDLEQIIINDSNYHKKQSSICIISPCNDREQHQEQYPTVNDLCEYDISNSSWSEQMPYVIGGIYNLTPPLSNSLRQRFILDFLKSVGEYQDYLPIFIENNVLNIIKHFIYKNKYDGFLTFKAVHFLGTLLCHNKIATEFIVKHHGIDQLLSVYRPSMGSTGVSMCLYYLSYKVEAMENVCQLPKSKLSNIAKYATWLLECSHESGRCHSALFFSFSFSFNIILEFFDKFDGLRCLLNMISMSSSIQNLGSGRENTDPGTSHQTIKVVCTTLRRYCDAHLLLKVISVQHLSRDKKWHKIVLPPNNKAIEITPEQITECLDFMRDFEHNSIQSLHQNSCLESWTVIDNFLKHKGIMLILQIIGIAVDLRVDYTGRLETIKAAMEVTAILTLSSKAQSVLLKQVETPNNENHKETGISLLLDIANGKYSNSGQDLDIQRSALIILLNCVYMPAIDGEQTHLNALGNGKISSNNIKQKMWHAIKENNGIQILLSLLINKQSEITDEISILACKCLYGLSHYRPIQQILTKLPMFNNGKLQVLTTETVMQGKQKEHALLCKTIDNLIQRVTGKPISFSFDNNAYKKSVIVSQTQVRFDNKELLSLIHGHLVWSGLNATASLLKKEAGLSTKILCHNLQKGKRQLPCTNNADVECYRPNETALESTPVCNRISFTRGSQAQGATPMSMVIPRHQTPFTPTTPTSSIKKQFKNRFKTHINSKYKLTQNGKVTLKPIKESGKEQKFTPCLNGIVEEYLKHQHVSCRNPVVTVPEFSLFNKHLCPENKKEIKAPMNLAYRTKHKEVSPPFGGIGGQSCDHQYVFSRFRPGYTVKTPDEHKGNYTCATFSSDDEQLLIGDYKGGVTVHSLYSDHDNIVEGVSSGQIVSLQPSKANNLLIVICETVWNNNCALFSMKNQFELKYTFQNSYYAEFSKTVEDKIIGTNNQKAMIFDATTGKLSFTLEKSDLTCNYTANRATFSWDDNLVLSDGLLWDIRASHTTPIHKFDKFSDRGDGLFHPRGTEVIINSEIWDLRNYYLLHTISAFDQKRLYFNKSGTIIYGVKEEDEEEDIDSWTPSNFSTFSAYDYKQLTTYPIKHNILSFAADGRDCHLAIVEKSGYEDARSYEAPISTCKLYDIGITKGVDDDDDDEDLDNNDSEDDDENDAGSNADDQSEVLHSSDSDSLNDMENDDLSMNDPFSENSFEYTDEENDELSPINSDDEEMMLQLTNGEL